MQKSLYEASMPSAKIRIPRSRSNLTLVKERNHSQVDIWVIPACFLRHNGLARVRRVAKSMKMKVERVTWLAKVNYGDKEGYGHRELVAIGKAMVANVPGLKCAWIHPRIPTRSCLPRPTNISAVPFQPLSISASVSCCASFRTRSRARASSPRPRVTETGTS